MQSPVVWTPSEERKSQAQVTRFMRTVSERNRFALSDVHDLYAWSIAEPESFWQEVWDFCDLRASTHSDVTIENPGRMPGARFFPEAQLNFAENLLRFRDDRAALLFRGESKVRRVMTYRQLNHEVACVASALESFGVKCGDRVAGCVANVPEAIVAMLAAASIGALWASCSPDFGVAGIVDRFGQIEPTVLFASDGYYFKDAWHDIGSKVAEVAALIPSLKHVIILPYDTAHPRGTHKRPDSKTRFSDYAELIAASAPALKFAPLPFNHPLYIMFSSGTTGKPKCIVHGAGGTLLEHLKELILHTDLKPQDTIFYQTTCGWMMWNWLVSSLAVGAKVLLYDGFPLHCGGSILFDLVDEEHVTIFGTNAKYIALCEKSALKPRTTHSLSSVHTILSTGSPLLPESFDYVYRDIKKDVCLSSISGGTDIIGCFALGSPLLEVRRGELQMRSLGLKVEVFDAEGKSLLQQKGELVCSAPFPSMPLSFWNDADGRKYKSAYFERYPNVWHHGDYVELTQNGGMIFYGRSDAVLNPGGVRIGSAEIYRQVEKIAEVLECVAVAQEWEGDVRIVLFVRLQPEHSLTPELLTKIKQTIRDNTTPFHVPKKIIALADIPRTRSGKIVELAIRDVIHGRLVSNREALANPEALDLFRNLPELGEA